MSSSAAVRMSSFALAAVATFTLFAIPAGARAEGPCQMRQFLYLPSGEPALKNLCRVNRDQYFVAGSGGGTCGRVLLGGRNVLLCE